MKKYDTDEEKLHAVADWLENAPINVAIREAAEGEMDDMAARIRRHGVVATRIDNEGTPAVSIPVAIGQLHSVQWVFDTNDLDWPDGGIEWQGVLDVGTRRRDDKSTGFYLTLHLCNVDPQERDRDLIARRIIEAVTRVSTPQLITEPRP
jgi:hypothetical protein